MKPGFALSLSFEGISLLFRSSAGWRRVGDVRVDDPGLDQALDGLRRSALALSRGGLRSKIVIPNDQIRYLTIETGEVDEDARRRQARTALDGATPYDVGELAIDIAADGPLTHIAAVAHETLAEAETFAVQHRFDPVSFVAIPGQAEFLGEPFFGETEHAHKLLAFGEQVEPDTSAIEIVERSDLPDGPVATAPEAHEPTNIAESKAAEPVAGFSSRRRKRDQSDDSPAKAAPPADAPRIEPIKPLPPAQHAPHRRLRRRRAG